jgi:hypothetical protein
MRPGWTSQSDGFLKADVLWRRWRFAHGWQKRVPCSPAFSAWHEAEIAVVPAGGSYLLEVAVSEADKIISEASHFCEGA